MDYVLLFFAFLLMVGGILGSFLPILPGPPLSWVGLLLLYLTEAVPLDYTVLSITFGIALVVSVLDYVIPAKGTKQFGGSKSGIWGTNIGLLLGLLLPIPFGFIIGPFVGALMGELLNDSKDIQKACKAALGSFVGFLASTFLKLAVALAFFGFFLRTVWAYRNVLF